MGSVGWAATMWKVSVFPSQLCWEFKTVFKEMESDKVLLFQKQKSK